MKGLVMIKLRKKLKISKRKRTRNIYLLCTSIYGSNTIAATRNITPDSVVHYGRRMLAHEVGGMP
jgi:hypothetical protein